MKQKRPEPGRVRRLHALMDARGMDAVLVFSPDGRTIVTAVTNDRVPVRRWGINIP